jgi:hypothetical protein
MFKTNENQIIAVYIDGLLYATMQGNFPIKAFKQLIYGAVDPEANIELKFLMIRNEIREDQVIDISDGITLGIEVENESVDIYSQVELVALYLLKP